MPRFRLEISETQWKSCEIEAETEEDARQHYYDHQPECDYGDIENEEITEIVDIEEQMRTIREHNPFTARQRNRNKLMEE